MTTQRDSQRRGNYSMFMGVMCASLIGFGALGVDVSYIAMSNNQAQAVADAASHAALIAYRYSNGATVGTRVSDGQAAANHIVNSNRVGIDGTGNLRTLQFGQFNPNTGNFSAGAQPFNAAYAEVDRSSASGNPLNLFLAPVIGNNTADLRQDGVTASNPREIIVVVDRSCSMRSPAGYGGWEGVRDALDAFAEYMIDHQVPLDMLGVAAFTNYSNEHFPLTFVDGNEAAIATEWANYGFCTRSPDGWAPPGTDYGYDKGETMYACEGNTDPRDGINEALAMFTESTNPLAFKAVIVISDGEPTGDCSDADFLNAAQNAWDNDVHVWTVGFGTVDDDIMTAAAKGEGSYYPSPGPEGLTNVMLEIARSIPVVISE